MEDEWDPLWRAGWVPDRVPVALSKQWSDGTNILPSIAARWSPFDRNVISGDRQRSIREWLLKHADNSQLTIGWPGSSLRVTPRLLWWRGRVPSGRRIGVLSSRLGRQLEQRPLWFYALRILCSRLDPAHDQLLTCESTATDRFLKYCGRRFGLRIIVLQRPNACQSMVAWLRQLVREESIASTATRECPVRLSPRLTALEVESADGHPEADWMVSRWADELYVLYLRPGGRLHQMVTQLLKRSDHPPRIHLAFGTGLVPGCVANELLSSGAIGWYLASGEQDWGIWDPKIDFPTALDTAASAPIVSPPLDGSWTYLVHWTRRQRGPWPDQEDDAYLNELLFDFRRADRSPLAALMRIVTMQRIVATRQLIRGAFDVVCFTERRLSEFAGRRTFRNHQQRWDFEPYGLCIDRQWLIDRNARPVIYGDDPTWQRMSPDMRPFFQRRETRPSPAGRQIRWSDEREWRHVGDIDLHALPAASGLVFVPTKQAAHRIASVSRWPVTVIDGEQGGQVPIRDSSRVAVDAKSRRLPRQ